MRKLLLVQVICLLPFMFAFAQFSAQQNNNLFASIGNQDGIIEMYHNNQYVLDVYPQPKAAVKTVTSVEKMLQKTQFYNDVTETYHSKEVNHDLNPKSEKRAKKTTTTQSKKTWVKMHHVKGVSYGIRYQPKMKVKESKKVRKWLKKAYVGKKQIAKTAFQLVPNKEDLTLTAYLNAADKSIYHIKLMNEAGQLIQSFPHLSSTTIQEIQLNQLLPGKYHLSLYTGIERRLVSTYDLKY